MHCVTLLHCSSQICEKSHVRVVLSVDGVQAFGTGDAETIEDASIAAVNNALKIQLAPRFIDSMLTHNSLGRKYILIMNFNEGYIQGIVEGTMPEPNLYVLGYIQLLSHHHDFIMVHAIP